MVRSELPQDLVSDILMRLPVKSLMRFKCVERSWNDLFRTPTFVNRYFQMHRHEERIMISHSESPYIHYRRFSIISDSHTISQVEMEYLFPEFESRWSLDQVADIELFGHCNGVFCLFVYYIDGPVKFTLWNPATREVKDVPPPPHMPSHDYCLRYSVYHSAGDVFRGFGVDPNSNELKLVNLVIDHRNRLHPPSAELYNLGTNSWTLFCNDTVPVNAINLWPPKVCDEIHVTNGVCYWLDGIGEVADPAILCFDFGSNQFRKLKRPTNYLYGRSEFVTELNDSVAYVTHCYNLGDLWAAVWILEEDSWTKKYNFCYDVCIFAIWKGGTEFLGADHDANLILYNSNGDPVHNFQYFFPSDLHVRKYVESIAPLSF